MTLLRLRYLKVYRDRHGTVRRYVRRRGQKDLRLKGEPGTIEFMLAYQAALVPPRPWSTRPSPEPSEGSSPTTTGPWFLPTSDRRRRSFIGWCSIALGSGMAIVWCGTHGVVTPAK